MSDRTGILFRASLSNRTQSPHGEHWTDAMRQLAPLKNVVISLRRWRNRAIDKWLGISTPYPHVEKFALNTCFSDAVPNEPVDYLLMRRFLKHLHTTPDDVVYDIGSGMGRTLCLLARREVRKCIGIEFDPRLTEIARHNAQRLRGRKAAIEVRCGDAVQADYAGGTVYWLFNPFGAGTMRVVLDRIAQTLSGDDRAIRMVYVNPVHEHLFAECGWLQFAEHVRSPLFGTYGASYWQHTPSTANAALQRIEERTAQLDTQEAHSKG